MKPEDYRFPAYARSPAERERWIEGEIRYEEHTGIHTYHRCDCGRGLCRTYMCGSCWRDLAALHGIPTTTPPRRGGEEAR